MMSFTQALFWRSYDHFTIDSLHSQIVLKVRDLVGVMKFQQRKGNP